MKTYHYVGLDVHKKMIAYCIKAQDGRLLRQGTINSNRRALYDWTQSLTHPWIGALEATLFTGWIYDFLKHFAVDLKVAQPSLLKAISAAKKKNDRIDAQKIADMLRCNLLPECHMIDAQLRQLRRVLRYRNLIVREAVRMKNKTAGLLMEIGVEYNKQKLHGKKYFDGLLQDIEDVPPSVIELLTLSHGTGRMFEQMQKKLLNELYQNELICQRVLRLMTIGGIGQVSALTWALEIGDPNRFKSISRAVSYCGLCSAQRESAGKSVRGPISKKRNKHLQRVLIEAAKLAPRFNEQLARVHQKELARGNRNSATLAVARKLVAFMIAVDKRGTGFESRPGKKLAEEKAN